MNPILKNGLFSITSTPLNLSERIEAPIVTRPNPSFGVQQTFLPKIGVQGVQMNANDRHVRLAYQSGAFRQYQSSAKQLQSGNESTVKFQLPQIFQNFPPPLALVPIFSNQPSLKFEFSSYRQLGGGKKEGSNLKQKSEDENSKNKQESDLAVERDKLSKEDPKGKHASAQKIEQVVKSQEILQKEDFSTSNTIKQQNQIARNRKQKEQLKLLEAEFLKDQQWSKEKVKKLAKFMKLKESQIYKWNWDRKFSYAKKIHKRIERDDVPYQLFQTIKVQELDPNGITVGEVKQDHLDHHKDIFKILRVKKISLNPSLALEQDEEDSF